MSADTRTRRSLRRIGIARARLAFLQQHDPAQLTPIRARFAARYRIPASEMQRGWGPEGAGADRCARALAQHLDQLRADASGIRGLGRCDAELVNDHLRALGRDCASFAPGQPLSDASAAALWAAIEGFLARGMGSGQFAGSAIA